MKVNNKWKYIFRNIKRKVQVYRWMRFVAHFNHDHLSFYRTIY